jgi:hypothetical protein
MSFEDEFLKGARDCQEGKPHDDGKGEYYDRGYATQYEMEQIQTAESERNYGR